MNAYMYKPVQMIVFTFLLVLLGSCTEEFIADEPLTDHNSVILSLSTRIGDTDSGLGSERAVHSLRLIIFDSEGVQIKNSFYKDSGLDVLETEGGVYRLSERLPRDLGQIRVCLIANEPSGWGLGSTNSKVSYASLTNRKIHYSEDFDFINNNGRDDDLNLYISPDDYFLMYAETTVHFIAGNMDLSETLLLDRTAAKVTLTLKYGELKDVDYGNNETFVLKSAAIQNQPVFSHLFPQPYTADNDYFSTSYQNLDIDTEAGGSASPTYTVTRPVTFYIPEHYLSQEAFDSGLYTYIEILGEYTTGGIKIPVTYRVPLGEGAQKIVQNSGYNPDKSDYSVMRNHHYVVDGTVTKLGEKDGVQAKISIAEWNDGGSVDVESPAPYLNVSEVMLQRYLSADGADVNDKIFFWSNQPRDQIMVESISTTYYDADGAQMDVSSLLSPELLPQIRVEMTKYTQEGDGVNFFENNGYVLIDVRYPSIVWERTVTTFYIRAGNLKRKITMRYDTKILST